MNKTIRPLFSLSWQSLVYGIGIFGRQLVLLISLPIITNLVDQSEYGVISIITSFYMMVNTITNVGIPSAIFRLYNDDISQDDKDILLGTSQYLFLVLALALAVLLSVFSQSTSVLILGSGDYWLSIVIVAILLVVETMNFYGAILLRLQTRPIALSIHTIVMVVSQMGLAIFLIQIRNLGVIGYWIGFLFGAVIGLVLMIWLNRKVITLRFSTQAAGSLLRYGIPLIPVTMTISLMQLTDRYFLRTFLGLDLVAVYTIGFRVGSIVNLVLAPFQYAWPNFAFARILDADARKIYKDVSTLVLFATGGLSLGIYLFRSELISIISPENYQQATLVVPWICAAMILNGLHPVFSVGPKIRKETKPLARISVLVMAVNIILLLVLIPAAGMTGAGIATFLSFLIFAAGNYYLTVRSYHFPLDWRRIGIILVTIMALSWLGNLLPGLFSGSSLVLIRLMILGLYPILLLLLGIFPIKNISELMQELMKNLKTRDTG